MSVRAQSMRSMLTWLLWFSLLLGLTGLLSLLLFRQGPDPANVGWLLLLLGIGATLYRPRYGVYLLVGLTLLGDRVLLPWWPFTKNFSSVESLLFLSKGVIFSPAELFIVLTFGSWLGRAAVRRKLERWHAGPLFWPAAIFIGFTIFGLVYGLRRGERDIGLQEARALFYIFALVVLTSNLITQRAHVIALLWSAVIANCIDAVSGFWMVMSKYQFDLSYVDKIAEHSNSIHLNSMFVLFLAGMIFRTARRMRFLLLLAMPFILTSYIANQRRAAFISLMIACAVLAIVLFSERRRTFWLIVPAAALVGLLYVGAFWNNDSVLGLPANAVRTALTPPANVEDYRSNEYRVIENFNIRFTIGQAPLTGIGFGQKFFIVRPLPSIDFVWWEYITHNSILWIWMKLGVGGFMAMLYLIGTAVMTGTQVYLRMPGGMMKVAALTATLYIVMHFVFAYVDMSWEAQSMIYVGAMMGLVNSLERIVATPAPRAQQRWPWEPEPEPEAGLRPL